MAEKSPIDYVKSVVIENYANFSGRARRAEYWWFTLFSVVLQVVLFGLAVLLGNTVGGIAGAIPIILYVLVYLALLVPALAVAIRRLHDTGKTGWLLLIAFIPLVGPLVLLFFMATDGDRESNQYGPSPKYGAVAA